MRASGVIINADDFGLAPGVNRGIVSGFRDGVLTSTTMLVNLEFFDDAVALARSHPELRIGVHLSLLWGRPVSDPARVPTLVGRDGRFPRSVTTLARRYVLGRLSLVEVREEFRAQVRKFLDQGLTPTHLDTHKHVHALPGILRAVLDVAREFDVGRVRVPYENGASLRPGSAGAAPSWRAAARREAVRLLCRGAHDAARRAGVRTPDHFVGLGCADHLDGDTLRLILQRLREGVTEVMCHPGYDDEHLRRYARVPPHRERELEGLLDPRVRECAAASGVRLMSYAEL
jgi:hopanoid biosynthesis associated protein HpnK